jgi:hypothetical protein
MGEVVRKVPGEVILDRELSLLLEKHFGCGPRAALARYSVILMTLIPLSSSAWLET